VFAVRRWKIAVCGGHRKPKLGIL